MIEELLQTEQDYLQSLNLVMHVFLAADAEKVTRDKNGTETETETEYFTRD